MTEYGGNNSVCKEDDSCYPTTHYGFSKLMQTIRIKQLANRYSLKARVGRVFTPFGNMKNPMKLLNQVLDSLKNKILELSPCEQSRFYLY